MKRMLVLLLSSILTLPSCAAARRSGVRFAGEQSGSPRPDSQRMDPALMRAFVRQLPVGSRVKIQFADGKEIRGTLMNTDADPIVIQRRTRLPEPPVSILIAEIAAMEIETGSSLGKAIAIGTAAGAGATLGVLMLLAALLSD